MPTVLMTNWMMSVSVSDHMPPSTEYSTMTALLSKIAGVRGMPTITSITEPTAMVAVTLTMRS